MEQGPLYDQVAGGAPNNPMGWGGIGNNCNPAHTAYGPRPWYTSFEPWVTQIPGLLCPSDPSGSPDPQTRLGRNNYKFCWGDKNHRANHQRYPFSGGNWRNVGRGIFGFRSAVKIANIKDGTSNTIAMAEACIVQGNDTGAMLQVKGGSAASVGGMVNNPSACLARVTTNDEYIPPVIHSNRGHIWAQGQFHHNGFQTILPPNGPNCSSGTTRGATPNICSAQSYHPGGVNVVLADGSCQFISETIDTGDPTAPIPRTSSEVSPYGIWGALGSRSGGEASVQF
jgi:prepilin-type processing-associated H-X9-DG protein